LKSTLYEAGNRNELLLSMSVDKGSGSGSRLKIGDSHGDNLLDSPVDSRESNAELEMMIAWLRDDGFGSEVVKRLATRELPAGVSVVDFGTGGLDLAYEVMRGYDALILIDVSRQGEPPGTLYVMEAEEADVDAQIEDGQLLDPHGMDPATVLRFVKYVGGWPGRGVTGSSGGGWPAGSRTPGAGHR